MLEVLVVVVILLQLKWPGFFVNVYCWLIVSLLTLWLEDFSERKRSKGQQLTWKR